MHDNTINYLDILGLDTAGCDMFPDATPCIRECCAEHDCSYDQNDCSSDTWSMSGIKDPNDLSCIAANYQVMSCIIDCGFSLKNDPDRPDYYCARMHRYVEIPGDFPDIKSAVTFCDSTKQPFGGI